MDASLTQRFVFSSLPPKGMKKSVMVSWSLLDEMYMRNTPRIMENCPERLFLADSIISRFSDFSTFSRGFLHKYSFYFENMDG